MKTTIKVAITDDDTLILNLLSDFLKNQENIEVVFTAVEGSACMDALNAIQAPYLPDVLLLDLQMKGKNGVETLQEIQVHFPSIKTIIISSMYDANFIGFLVKNGVAAFIPKGVSPSKLVEIIREVNEKGFYFMEEQMTVIREQLSSPFPRALNKEQTLLSERETEVLHLIAQQKTAKEIGEILFIAQRTVEGHKNALLEKTGTKNTAGLIMYGIKNGYLNPDEFLLL